MLSILTRNLTLGVCLLGSIACAPKTLPSAESPDPRMGKRFGEPSDMVFAGPNDASLFPATGYLQYPEGERRRGVEAAFAVAFVLDSIGRPEYPSVSFIGNAAPSFYSEVCRFLNGARYAPVRRDGVLRRAFVVADFTFTLEPQDGPNLRVHVQPVSVRTLRSLFVAKGLTESIKELETRRHCM